MPEGDTAWVSPVSGAERSAPQLPEASPATELTALSTGELVDGFLNAKGAPDMTDAYASLYDLAEGPGAVAKEGYYVPLRNPEEVARYERFQTELVRRAAIRLGILAVDSGEAKNNGE